MNAPFRAMDEQAALGFVRSQTTYVEQQVNETVYPDIQYQQLIPVDTAANPFAQTVTYYSSDKFGRADWINGNADDIPLAGTELAEHKTAVYTAAIGYGWGWEEVNVAMMLGRNLQNDGAMAARRAYEEMVDRVALSGDATKGFEGLIDHSAVTAASVTTGDWATATEDQILADVNEVLLGITTGTAETAAANTLLLPYTSMAHLASNRLGDTGTTILDFLRRNNVVTAMTGQDLLIRTVRGLDTAGSGNTRRMIAYRRDPNVLRLHIPMPHRFLPVYQDGPLRWVVPGVFRLGGLDIRRPKEIRYGDGL